MWIVKPAAVGEVVEVDPVGGLVLDLGHDDSPTVVVVDFVGSPVLLLLLMSDGHAAADAAAKAGNAVF